MSETIEPNETRTDGNELNQDDIDRLAGIVHLSAAMRKIGANFQNLGASFRGMESLFKNEAETASDAPKDPMKGGGRGFTKPLHDEKKKKIRNKIAKASRRINR